MDQPPGTTLLIMVGLHPWAKQAVASTSAHPMPWGAQYLRAGAVPPHVEQHGEPERRRDSEHAAQEVVQRRPAFRPRSLPERREQGERARDEEEVHPVAAEVRRCIDPRRQARHALARVDQQHPEQGHSAQRIDEPEVRRFFDGAVSGQS